MGRWSGLGGVVLAACCIGMSGMASSFAQAGPPSTRPSMAHSAEEVDTEHLFGFVEGADIGKKGELEGESENEGGFGKRSGSYAAVVSTSMLKYSLTDDFRVAPWVASSYHNISGVPGFADRHGFAFQGVGAELRLRLLDRERAPFGLTLNVSPHWSRIDDLTGERVSQFGAEFIALFDKELVHDRIYGAFNVLYDPAWTRLGSGEMQRNATVGVSAAISNRVSPWLFLGGEIRYMRAYEGVALNTLAGDALYVGPTAYVILSPKWNMTLAWNIQVAGHAVGDPGALDLVNFERHQARLRIGYHF
jgi:hypothetical protein